MWYAANLLFKSTHSMESDEASLWEESIRLIWADTKEDAQKKADAIGKLAQVSYPVEGNDSVQWVFSSVERIYEIDAQSLEHGTEIFSRFLRDSEVRSLQKPFE